MFFDREQLEELVGGDEETAREIATLFVTDTRELLAAMREALQQRDEAVVKRLGHTLKSSAAAVGCAKASEMSARIEAEGLAAAHATLAALTAHLEEAFIEMGDLVDLGQIA